MASAVIYAIQTVDGSQPTIMRRLEAVTQSFLAGAPVIIDGTGGVAVWGGATIAKGIAGIAKTPGSSLVTINTPKTLTFGAVPFQASAVNIPRGAPFNDARVDFEVANEINRFFGQVGPSQTTAVTDLGVEYGMTVDTDGHWYVDKTKSTAGVNTVVTVVKLDTLDTTRGVIFKFSKAAQQLT